MSDLPNIFCLVKPFYELCYLAHIIRSRVRPAVIAAAAQLRSKARDGTVSGDVLLEPEQLVLRQFTMADVDNLVRPGAYPPISCRSASRPHGWQD